jgi:O-6-methylguanine DNA methyltransferase
MCETGAVVDPIAVRTVIPGPWGPFHIAATERGIVALEWLTSEPAFAAALAKRLGAPVAATADVPADDPRQAHLAVAVAALETLLAGHAPDRAFRFDLTDRPAWDRHVLEAVVRIPWGHTASYGQIARQVGAPRAARAVGGAVGRNPVSLLIPCHRVIAADGGIGGYGSDGLVSRAERLAMKRDLLSREGVVIANDPC